MQQRRQTVEDVLGKYDHELFPPEEAKTLRLENEQVVATGEPLIGEQAVSLQGRRHVFRTNKSPHRDVDGSVIGVIDYRSETMSTRKTCSRTVSKISVRASERAGRIVRSVLTFAGQQESTKEPCDLATIARRACDLTRHVAKRSGISIRLKCDENLPQVRVNPLEIEQVFVNVINNALEASDASSTITMRLEIEGDFAKVSVCDEGCGLTEEQKVLIFDPFYTTRPESGGDRSWLEHHPRDCCSARWGHRDSKHS